MATEVAAMWEVYGVGRYLCDKRMWIKMVVPGTEQIAVFAAAVRTQRFLLGELYTVSLRVRHTASHAPRGQIAIKEV